MGKVLYGLLVEGGELLGEMDQREDRQNPDPHLRRMNLLEIVQWAQDVQRWAKETGAIVPEPADNLNLVLGWEIRARSYVMRATRRLSAYYEGKLPYVDTALQGAAPPGTAAVERYDVVLSFAGEDRVHAEALAKALQARRIRVFYDEFEKADLWGKNLYEYLAWVYKDNARFCIMFLSEHYARKAWTNHERRSAQARAFQENREYILPLKLDDTEIQGILPTVGYVDLRNTQIEEVCDLLETKLRSA